MYRTLLRTSCRYRAGELFDPPYWMEIRCLYIRRHLLIPVQVRLRLSQMGPTGPAYRLLVEVDTNLRRNYKYFHEKCYKL